MSCAAFVYVGALITFVVGWIVRDEWLKWRERSQLEKWVNEREKGRT